MTNAPAPAHPDKEYVVRLTRSELDLMTSILDDIIEEADDYDDNTDVNNLLGYLNSVVVLSDQEDNN